MLKQKIHDLAALSLVGLASVTAATVVMAAAVDSNSQVTGFTQHRVVTRVMSHAHLSRRNLVDKVQNAPAHAVPVATCTNPAPTTCPVGRATCVPSNGSVGGVGRWVCKPAMR